MWMSLSTISRASALPRKLSQLGPGVTWFDFNGDGWEDLSSARDGRTACGVSQRRQGRLVPKAKPQETPPIAI
jgi:hypothetical protein